jgi:hypothetical protein
MNISRSLFLLSSVMLAGLASYAQPSHPHSPHDTVRSKNVTVTYGRPYKKGREIFGKLEPYGKVYRIGADEATTITFAKDATFGGKAIKAGTYAMFGIPYQDHWTIILNSQPHQWGLAHDQNKDKDVLQTDVPVTNLAAPVEQLTIAVKDSGITITWDTVKIMVPISI